MTVRQRIFKLIQPATEGDTASAAYDAVMLVAIVASLIPLCFKESTALFVAVETICTALFIVDYVARLVTADMLLSKGKRSFAIYPITPTAILDLLSILPGLIEISPAFRVLRIARLLKILRIFRFVRYSKSLAIVTAVIQKEKNLLLCVFGIAIGYVLVTAMVVFNVEPETFDTFFDACYWACVSLTTVGYGDIFCTSAIGKTFTMISAFVGIAIVALPAGIVTGGFIDEMRERRDDPEG